MKKFLTIMAFLGALITNAQQPNGKISGSIIDGSQKTVEAATITLMTLKDSSAVKFSVADKTGKYLFENIKNGDYFISVTAVGHLKGYSAAFSINENSSYIELKTIALKPIDKSMEAITVTAKKPLIEQKIDRTIVNVEASPTNVGSSALEVLEKAPGVTVDKDGNISLKGKGGVAVYIDGRPTYLSATDLANMLKSMNANQLDKIEIMTNPPAKYDAAGNSGIINIQTKKNKQFGYNGSISLGYGQGAYPKTNEGFNFNYRKGKVNLFTNLSHNYHESFNHLTIQRSFKDASTKQLLKDFRQDEQMLNLNNSYNVKLGLDYDLTKKTTLGAVITGFSDPGRFTNRNSTLIFDPTGTEINETRAQVVNKETFTNFGANLNFRQVLDTNGKELTGDFDYLTYHSNRNQSLVNSYFDPNGNANFKPDTLLGTLPQIINIYSGKIDYVKPLGKDARFEAGIKSSYVKTDNNANYDSLQNGSIVHDFNRSNYFVYEENINAVYGNLSGPLSKKFNGQLGLRVENTNAKGVQLTTGQTFNRHYTQLFPTAYLQYVVNKNNNLVMNYGRRIRRPDYQSLNPFIEFLDRYTYQQGNPDLKPQFSQNIELSHTYKNFLTTTLNYSSTTDIIQRVIQQNEIKNETYVREANIASQKQFGLSVNIGMPVTKWWTNNLYVSVMNNKYEGMVGNDFISISGTTLMLNGSQQFKLSKTLSTEISGFYRTAGVEGVILAKPFGMVSFGLSQQVLKNQGTLRLNIRDIFNTQYFQGVTKYGNIDASFQERHDNRVVNLGFTYRFSKGKMSNRQKRRTGSASDEAGRVGGGKN